MSVKAFDEPRIEELSGCRYRTRFVDGSGATLDPTSILGIEATLTDVETDVIVNGRDAQHVLNANDGKLYLQDTIEIVNGAETVVPAGTFQLSARAEDNAIVAPTQPRIIHGRRLTLRVRYRRGDSVDDTLHHQAEWVVVNLQDAPMSDEVGSP